MQTTDPGTFRSTTAVTANDPFVDVTATAPKEGELWSVGSAGPHATNEAGAAAVSKAALIQSAERMEYDRRNSSRMPSKSCSDHWLPPSHISELLVRLGIRDAPSEAFWTPSR